MIRLLRINGTDVDIDDKTAIGINLQKYDIKKPGKRLVSSSNSFTIPATANNRAIFGNAADPQSRSTKIYDVITCDYWVDVHHIIKNAQVRVEEIAERISLFVFEKPDVFDLLKKVSWEQFQQDYIIWLQANKGIPSEVSPFVGSMSDFVDAYIGNDSPLKFAYYFGNLYNYDPQGGENYLEDEDNIYLNYDLGASNNTYALAGHMCTYWRDIFEYIEDTYNVSFITQGGEIIGNIWDDDLATKVYTPIRNITPIADASLGAVDGWWFDYVTTEQANIRGRFRPLNDIKDKEDKTLYDCINTFFTTFQIVIDDVLIDGAPAMRLARFSDLEKISEVVHFGNLGEGMPKFKAYLDGYAQSSYINYASTFPEAGETAGRVELTCGNKNIDTTVDLFSYDAYFAGVITGTVPLLDLSTEESFKTFEVLIDSDNTNLVDVRYYDSGFSGQNFFTNKELRASSIYSIADEYSLLNQILDAPRYYEAEKWLSLLDVINLQFFKLYFIPELGGSFFINKVSGYNPELSNKATKLELIKISDRTPVTPPDLDYWMDGVEDPFTDGIGDIFY